MLASLVIFLNLLILLFLLSMVWPPDSPWSPWWQTSKRIARIQCKLAKIGKGDVVYDLGSGDGTALITAAKEFGARGVGVEIDPSRVFYSKMAIILSGMAKKIEIVSKNFFAVDVSEATV